MGATNGKYIDGSNRIYTDRAKRFRGLAVTARLAAAKAVGELHDSYVRVAEKWERLAQGAEALVVAHAAEVTENPPAHPKAAFKLPDVDEPKAEG